MTAAPSEPGSTFSRTLSHQMTNLLSCCHDTAVPHLQSPADAAATSPARSKQ